MEFKTAKGKIYDSEDLVIRGVPVNEQETIVNVARDQAYMEVYTSDNTYLTKLRKLMTISPDKWKLIDVYEVKDNISGVKVRAPKNLLSLRSGTSGKDVANDSENSEPDSSENSEPED